MYIGARNALFSLVFCIVLFFGQKSSAQLYGNEWIDTTKLHVKFTIGKQGIYRIGYFTLEQYFADAGTFLSKIPFDQFRIYNMGQQVPMYIKDQNANNFFDIFDYVEFVGHPLDGSFDTELYKTPSDQRNTLASLIGDSNYYFFTFRTNGSSALRYIDYSNPSPPSTPPKSYHDCKVVYAPIVYYENGEHIIIGDKEAFTPGYTKNEGFCGDLIGVGQEPVIYLPTPKYNNSGFTPYLETGVVGYSSYFDNIYHHITFSVSPTDADGRVLLDTSFATTNMVMYKDKLQTSDIGSDYTRLTISSSQVNGVPSFSKVAHSHTILHYPKEYFMSDSAEYAYVEDSSLVAENIEWNGYGDGFFSMPVIYDETNLYRISGNYVFGQKKVTYTLPPRPRKGLTFIQDDTKIATLNAVDGHPVAMHSFDNELSQNAYLIVTSKALANSPKNEVTNYAIFWSQQYNVYVNLIEDLYNSFSYGIPHPLAIRHFCKYQLEKSSANKIPRNLLLMGRGFDMSYNRGISRAQLLPYIRRNHIPALGTPVSDNLFTAGLMGTTFEPAIPTGRISADTAPEIEVYRQKLISYTNSIQNYEDWQKNVLHLSGGASPSQALLIRNRMARMENYVTADPFAGTVLSYSKSAGANVDVGFRAAITNRINNGVNLVTFLGHGSSSVTDIDIGDPNDYLNSGKLPIFYFNGCQVGNPCIPQDLKYAPLSERVIKVPNAGGIAFLGQTTLSELYTVATQMERMYLYYFDSVRDKSLGNVIQSTIKIFQTPNNSLNRLHCEELFLQGDPAIPVFAPVYPDFAVTNGSLFLDPPNTIALQDSFRVGVIMRNFGKGVKDSFTIHLTRLYPDGITRRDFYMRWRMKGLVDTAYFVIKSKDISTGGKNIFGVILNPEHLPIEFRYENNDYQQEFILPTNGVNLISPKRFAIVGTDSVEMQAEASDIFKQNEDYYFEIDTTPWFNSPLLISLEKAQTPLTARVLAKWKVKLPVLKDTQVYFWRARLSSAKNEGGAWSMNSFTYIKNHGEGWMQNVFWQYQNKTSNNIFDRLDADSASRSLQYKKTLKKIYIDCAYGQTSGLGVKEGGFTSQDLNYGVCTGGGLVCIPWDGRTLKRKPVDTSIIKPECEWGLKWTTFGHFEDYQIYYAFEMGDTQSQNQFIKFINAMDDSMYVTIYCRGVSHADIWQQSVFTTLHKIGCKIFDTLSYRTTDAMWVTLGRKGWVAGKAQEAFTFGNAFAYVQLEGEMIGDNDDGSMLSEKIGPTNQFNAMYLRKYIDTSKNSQDDLSVFIYGLKSDGNSDVLKQYSGSGPLSLTFIDPVKYKFIQLKAASSDYGKHTSPNLLNWRVVYDPVPEGSLYPDAKLHYIFHEDTLYEGDSFYVKLPFKNISKVKFRDSLRLDYTFSNKSTRQVIKTGKMMFTALAPDSFFTYVFKWPTIGMSGPYTLQVNVNQFYEQPEVTLVNNSTLLNFFVSKDIMSPLLDVTFDGRHILQGDIVSANPVIMITSKDENTFLLQKDSSTFDLFIKKPGSSTFDKLKWGTDAIFYAAMGKDNKARIEYRPKDMPGGTYTLKVQSRDASQNQAGTIEYQIDFNVIREQAVTHFYPYPNPFTTNMRFVFTLTGTEVPDEILVKIMTAEGRVVKEVTKDELGDVHVGNNITSWAWDGTDQYGDKLANGTYFYKVSVKDKGQEVKLRASAGDQSFKEQVGVIYLMR